MAETLTGIFSASGAVTRPGSSNPIWQDTVPATTVVFSEQTTDFLNELATSGSAAINMGSLTKANHLLLVSDETVGVTLTGLKAKVILVLDGELSGLTVDNASGNAATIRTWMGGA